tara:strand:+ start:357 stop:506 length:150 start_codon:yes stop_codon:yes gene_type:complete
MKQSKEQLQQKYNTLLATFRHSSEKYEELERKYNTLYDENQRMHEKLKR